jgi:hypothetical protein
MLTALGNDIIRFPNNGLSDLEIGGDKLRDISWGILGWGRVIPSGDNGEPRCQRHYCQPDFDGIVDRN